MSATPRAGHPYHMHDAMYAQPGALRLVTRGNDVDGAAERIRKTARVVVCGIGSSWYAAVVAELLLAHVGRLGHRVRAVSAFDVTAYGPPLDADTTVIVISHSGRHDVVKRALAHASGAGAATIAVTGRQSDGLAAATLVLRTVAPEVSTTHTVSYTSALALLAALASRVGGDDDFAHELDELPDQLALLLGQESWDELAARYAGRRHHWFVGGGPNAATAAEGALKMQEAAYVAATGADVEHFMHGPWAACGADDLVTVIAPPGPARDRALVAARAAREIGAAVLALCAEDDRELTATATETIALAPAPELLSPILAVVPLQQLAYHTALARGANPDTMRTHEPAYGRVRRALSG
jgi:glucosamine--fructose-6-phosphate aminotransferase (isomerizing)